MRDNDYYEYRDHKAEHEHRWTIFAISWVITRTVSTYDVEGFGQRLDEWFSEHFRTRVARLHKMIF